MIRNKWLFFISIVLFIIFIFMRIPFPNVYRLGTSGDGILLFRLYFVSDVLYLLFFMITIYLFARSLSKRKVILSIVVIILMAVIPHNVVKGYQYTFANGIDAVSFDPDESSCEIDTIDEDNLEVNCNLVLKNHSSKDVELMLNIYEPLFMQDEVSLLFELEDEEAITLMSRATHQIEINKTITKYYDGFSGYSNSSFNIQNLHIREHNKTRDL
ncbi:hypothetical protein [Alkalicoccobacillus plakortidis]|uniref:Uncharacterized protein n=1 Tax=Alkalicoccobacillus plakortidis TaxID=444060 RepID=A0ABT0XH83_9BACI|nr:hypothetical protein [Alkalicoccobacillus plakortidis]MCM2674549.1 hypothetical protein [Alkalicoccobacillus plakortidis]